MPIREYESDVNGEPITYEIDLTPPFPFVYPKPVGPMLDAMLAELPGAVGYWFGVENRQSTLRVRFISLKGRDVFADAQAAYRVVLNACINSASYPPLKTVPYTSRVDQEPAIIIGADGSVGQNTDVVVAQ